MNLQLKSLKHLLTESNDKLEVIDYIYNLYNSYIEDDLKHYINQKHVLLEIKLMLINSEIDELYDKLENNILHKTNIIEKELKELQLSNNIKSQFAIKLIPYILHYFMLCDEDSIYYSISGKELDETEEEDE